MNFFCHTNNWRLITLCASCYLCRHKMRLLELLKWQMLSQCVPQLLADVKVKFDVLQTGSRAILGILPVSDLLQLTDLQHKAAKPLRLCLSNTQWPTGLGLLLTFVRIHEYACTDLFKKCAIVKAWSHVWGKGTDGGELSLFILFPFISFLLLSCLDSLLINETPEVVFHILSSDVLSFYDRPSAFLVVELLIQWRCGSESFYLTGLSISSYVHEFRRQRKVMRMTATPLTPDQDQPGLADTL